MRRMEQVKMSLMDEAYNFHRSSPYEHQQTAIAGHWNLLLTSYTTFGKPTVIVKPSVIPSSILIKKDQESSREFGIALPLDIA